MAVDVSKLSGLLLKLIHALRDLMDNARMNECEAAMGWSEETETEWDMLTRIGALLFALAVLADAASSAPHPVRCFVLWILRRAEVFARELVTGQVGDAAEAQAYANSAIMIAHHANGPADAVQLAQSFRALALELRKLAAQARRFARWRARQSRALANRRSPLQRGRAPRIRRELHWREEHRIFAKLQELVWSALNDPAPDTS